MKIYKYEINYEEGNKFYNQLLEDGFGSFLMEKDYQTIEHEGNKILVRPINHLLHDKYAKIPAGYYIEVNGYLYKPIPFINYNTESFILLISKPGKNGYTIYSKQKLNAYVSTLNGCNVEEVNSNDPFYNYVITFFELSDNILKRKELAKEAYFLYDFIYTVGNDSKCIRLLYIHLKETLKKDYNGWLNSINDNNLLLEAQKLRVIRHFCAHKLFEELSTDNLNLYKNSNECKLDYNLKIKINFI